MAIEYELKFQASPESQQAILAAVSGQETRLDMETVYYDTPNRDLSSKMYTLRKRRENENYVCTIKTPAQGNGRGEWETLCDKIEDAIAVLVRLGAPEDLMMLTRCGVQEICGAKFTRIAKTLEFDDGELELALDCGILTGGGREVPLCEVEVELKRGEPALADQYARVLARKFGLVPEKRSKFRRALDLAKGE